MHITRSIPIKSPYLLRTSMTITKPHRRKVSAITLLLLISLLEISGSTDFPSYENRGTVSMAKKNFITMRYDVNSTLEAAEMMLRRQRKQLKRLPHVFARVLELPLRSDYPVTVDADEDCFRFIAAVDFPSNDVAVHVVNIIPGVLKLVVRVNHGNPDNPRNSNGGSHGNPSPTGDNLRNPNGGSHENPNPTGENHNGERHRNLNPSAGNPNHNTHGRVRLAANSGMLDELDMDLWRFRLPPATVPEMSSVTYRSGILTVVVPKDMRAPLPLPQEDNILRSAVVVQ